MKLLWNDLAKMHQHQQGPWLVCGDFNNVLKSVDRIGGSIVQEKEYADLPELMRNTGLFEIDGNGEYYTWSNKHIKGVIYSRI